MRRVVITRPVTLTGVFRYEEMIEEGIQPSRHEISFEAGEVLTVHEWGCELFPENLGES